jgi:hypothetical protein
MRELTFAKVFTKMTRMLHELSQSIWFDDITRDLSNDGTLRRYREKARAA